MFFSKSTLIVEINNLDFTGLRNFSFFENNGEKGYSRKFYSITFENDKLNFGELHYTNSFEFGNMNVISFIRRGNLFFLFTSSVQHTKFLKKIVNRMLNEEKEYRVLRIPFSKDDNRLKDIKNLKIIKTDNFPGIAGSLTLNKNSFLIKIYNNGLITYPFTNDMEIIELVIDTYLEVLEKYEIL